MTSRDALLALADRRETSLGPNRQLDAQICRLLFLPTCVGPDCLPDVMARIIDRVEGGGEDCEVPAYTASLDAALTLVPEGWTFALYDRSGSNPIRAVVYQSARDSFAVQGSTLALSLVAAALRARANMENEDV